MTDSQGASAASVTVLRAPLRIVLEALEQHATHETASTRIGGAALYLWSRLEDDDA